MSAMREQLHAHYSAVAARLRSPAPKNIPPAISGDKMLFYNPVSRKWRVGAVSDAPIENYCPIASAEDEKPKAIEKPAASEEQIAARWAQLVARFLRRGPSLAVILNAVAVYFGISKDELLDGRHCVKSVRRRWVAYALIQKHGDVLRASTSQIGRAMLQDHTTIVWGMKRSAELLATDSSFADHVAEIDRRLRKGVEASR